MEHCTRGTGIEHSEQFYRNLFDELPIAFFCTGIDGRIRMANRQAMQVLGYQSDELIGRHFLDLYTVSPAGKVKAWEVFRKSCAGLEISGAELEMLHANGTSAWVRLRARPVRDVDGQVVASCLIVQEIDPPRALGVCHARGHDLLNCNTGLAQRLIPSPDAAEATKTHLERVLIKAAGCAFVLSVNEIDWVEAAGNYVQLHVGAKSYLLRQTMNHLEAQLDPRQFLRIHRSAIVNIQCIKELRARLWGDYHTILRDGTELTLSRGYRKKLRGAWEM